MRAKPGSRASAPRTTAPSLRSTILWSMNSSAPIPAGRSSSTAARATSGRLRRTSPTSTGSWSAGPRTKTPKCLLGVDPAIFGEAAPFDDAFDALGAFMPTIAKGLERGERLHDYTRHLLGRHCQGKEV